MNNRLVFLAFLLTSVYFYFNMILSLKSQELNKQVGYYRFDKFGNRSNAVTEVFNIIFKHNNIFLRETPEDAKLLLLNKLSDQHIFKHISNIPYYNFKYLYTLVSIDEIASKSRLYDLMRKNNVEELHDIFPLSYITTNSFDLEALNNVMKVNDKIVILKSNLQQQKGCCIVDSLQDLNLNNYVIAQELLQDPYLIKGRKINLRIYALISINMKNEFDMWLYNDGFLYYTPKQFQRNSTSFQANITTGYGDREFYRNNPLTLQDFESFLGKYETEVLQFNIRNLFETLFKSIKTHLLQIESHFKLNKFALFGCDIAVDSKLNLKLMEMNKGPDLSFKDTRDKNLKLNLVDDMLMTMRLKSKLNKTKNNWKFNKLSI